jgi:amino acid transporter
MMHEKLGVFLGLPVFASDAISSCAYATDEILLALAMAGAAGLMYSLPVAMAIVVIMFLVMLSYQQVIKAYPEGGGAYTVAKENLGRTAGLVAGAALLVDYILTVAVSVTSGIENIVSAWPVLLPHALGFSVLGIILLTWLNLRGVRESARVVALPVYIFILALAGMIVLGLWRVATNSHQPLPLPELRATHTLTIFLVLHAFASGCAALTGIEAVSNGVQAFREPHVRNARITLALLALCLAAFFAGITYLSRAYNVVPQAGTQTVLGILGRAVYGETWLYYVLQLSTLIILLLAANTSFQDFPRVARLLARDGFLPRQLANLGDRLVFSNGIALLGFIAAALVIAFHGSTHGLIPLYALGVFLSFTLSQVGMVRRWLKLRPAGYLVSVLFNFVGAVGTAVVLVVVVSAKFLGGAWMVVVAVPSLVRMFSRIRQHYDAVAKELTLEGFIAPRQGMTTVLIVPVASLHRGTVIALAYAKGLGVPVRAVHVVVDENQFRSLQERWKQWESDLPLIGLPSPYRSLVTPLAEYAASLRLQFDTVTVLIPQFIVPRAWEELLHNQSAIMLNLALRRLNGVNILHFRYQIHT